MYVFENAGLLRFGGTQKEEGNGKVGSPRSDPPIPQPYVSLFALLIYLAVYVHIYISAFAPFLGVRVWAWECSSEGMRLRHSSEPHPLRLSCIPSAALQRRRFLRVETGQNTIFSGPTWVLQFFAVHQR